MACRGYGAAVAHELCFQERETAMPIARELRRCDGSSEMMGGKTPPIKMIRMQKATAFCKQLPTANK